MKTAEVSNPEQRKHKTPTVDSFKFIWPQKYCQTGVYVGDDMVLRYEQKLCSTTKLQDEL